MAATVDRALALRVLVAIEDRLLAERERLILEWTALETARTAGCAAAVLVTGLLPAFIVGLERFCRAVDVAELETRRDTVATAISVIETSAGRLPAVADLLETADDARVIRAVESLQAVAAAASKISAVDDLVADTVDLLKGIAADAGGAVKPVGFGFGVVLGLAALGGLAYAFAGRRGR